MRFLLTLRHWQAFLLIFVLPFLLQYALTQLFGALSYAPAELLSTLVDALPATFLILWLWQIGLLFYHRLPASIRISIVYFHLAALYFLLYTLLVVYTMGIVRESITEGTLPFGMLLLLIPLHIFATFCFLYIVYFVARSIVSVAHQRIVEFGEYAVVLVQALFLPIGIWFLQPRLRQFS